MKTILFSAFSWVRSKAFVLFILLAISATLAVIGYTLNLGKKLERSDSTLRTINKATTIREKYNEIRNNRPDHGRLFDILQRGKY